MPKNVKKAKSAAPYCRVKASLFCCSCSKPISDGNIHAKLILLEKWYFPGHAIIKLLTGCHTLPLPPNPPPSPPHDNQPPNPLTRQLESPMSIATQNCGGMRGEFHAKHGRKLSMLRKLITPHLDFLILTETKAHPQPSQESN
jgi:hypothetical protein